MAKRRRTRQIEVYSEPQTPPINLLFTLSSFRALLTEGARPDGRYTHQQIKYWADQFWWKWSKQVELQKTDVPTEIEAAAALAQDIEMQWDMFLANTYTLPELQRLDFSQVLLPFDWFTDWLAQLDDLMPPKIAE